MTANLLSFAGGKFRVSVSASGEVKAIDLLDGKKVIELAVLNGLCYAVVEPGEEDRSNNLVCAGPAKIEWRMEPPLVGPGAWVGVRVRDGLVFANAQNWFWTILPGGLLWKGEFTK